MTAPGLALYRAVTGLLAPLANPLLARRVRAGKEDQGRLGERRGQPSRPRPDGPLVWLHAASVGESQVALALAETLTEARPDLFVLLTTGTRTSAGLVASRALPRLIHQFLPVDRADWTAAFLDAWRPDLGVFVESELWPNLISAARARGLPLALANARMNAGSLANWGRWPATARAVLGAFDWIGAADQRTAEGLSQLLGRSVPQVGNLKLETPPVPPAPDALAAVRAVIGRRPVFVAASTHAPEEALLVKAFHLVRDRHPDALMILAQFNLFMTDWMQVRKASLKNRQNIKR